MQPLVHILPTSQPVAQIPIQEHLVAETGQPPVQLTSQLSLLSAMAKKDPCHGIPCPVLCQASDNHTTTSMKPEALTRLTRTPTAY